MNRIFICMLLFFPAVLPGQEKSIPVNISLFSESTAIPFTRFLPAPVHPGLQAGSEYNYRIKEHSRLFQTINIGYYYHQYLSQGVGLNTEFGYEYRLTSGFSLAGLVGIGYMHTFATTEEFTFSDGYYQKKPDKGNARFYPSLSFDIGYYLKKSEKNSPKIFMRYQAWAEYPYSPDFIPVMTHVNVHFGVKFFIIKKNQSND